MSGSIVVTMWKIYLLKTYDFEFTMTLQAIKKVLDEMGHICRPVMSKKIGKVLILESNHPSPCHAICSDPASCHMLPNLL